ncbi:MAG: SMC-Scp complex subunit ScpB [Acidobacteriota bacterium]
MDEMEVIQVDAESEAEQQPPVDPEVQEARAEEAHERELEVEQEHAAESLAEAVATEEVIAQELRAEADDADLKAILEAVVYVTDEPLTLQQLTAALGQPIDRIKRLLDELVLEFAQPEHGLTIREVAGGYKMATKPEHHEAVRAFVKKLTPPLKLSLAALETLAVIAYKQPVTGPEIMEIRGVQGLGVLKTLLDRKLIAEGGRKNVVGKPILYKTTKEFLVQFGLKGLTELPTLKEFEELGRMELVEEAEPVATQQSLALDGDAENATESAAPESIESAAVASDESEAPATEEPVPESTGDPVE